MKQSRRNIANELRKIKVLSSYDELVPLKQLKRNTANKALYGILEKDRVYIESLKAQISKQGLIEPISLFKNSLEISSGNNRFVAISELGEEYVPVVYTIEKPKSELEQFEYITSENMRKVMTLTEKYKQVITMRNARIKETGSCEDKYIKEYCTKVQTTYVTFTKLNDILKNGRNDLFDRIDADSDALSISRAHGIMLQDLKKQNTVARHNDLDKLLTETHVKDTLIATSITMGKHFNIPTNIGGKDYYLTKTFQQNIISGDVHELITKTLSQILINDGVANEAPNSHTPYDLIIPSFDWKPDVKVAKWSGSNISNLKWTNSKQQSGYYILVATNKDVDRFYFGYGFIDGKDWKRAGRLTTLDLKTVFENKNIKQFVGEIKQDGTKYELHLDSAM